MPSLYLTSSPKRVERVFTMQNRNARFWMYLERGLVKITLKRGQRLDWEESYPTEEGCKGTTQATRGEFMRQYPQIYNKYAGRDIVKVVRVSDNSPV
jgi:hypothetical protein